MPDRRRTLGGSLPSIDVILRRIWVIALLILLFLATSFFAARWLTAENRERSAVVDLLQLQKQGDASGMLAQLEGCAQKPRCRADVESNARRLRGTGPLMIVRYDSGTSYSFGDASGNSRIAWDRGGATAVVVQCVSVERRGIVFFGGSIVLHSISRPIGGESACPS